MSILLCSGDGFGRMQAVCVWLSGGTCALTALKLNTPPPPCTPVTTLMKFGGSHRSPCVSPSSGLIKGCSGAAVGFKTEKNENILRIYGFEGEPGGRGGWRHGM